jgi:hypothetical protein
LELSECLHFRHLSIPGGCQFQAYTEHLARARNSFRALSFATVIDVRAGTIKKDMTVLIVGDRISAVRAAQGKERLPTKEITVIDGRGKYLIPRLWDMHVHSDGDDRALHLLIAYGVTGVRDMAGDVAKLADARHSITSGELIGPRLVFAGPMLEGPPSQADDWTSIIHSPEEVRNAVNG